jgi:TRAP-type C4-dicarboxylate transport system permease small subunit
LLAAIHQKIIAFSGFIVGIFSGVMTISVLIAVVARYILKISVPWTEELARYLAISLTYIGCGLGLREGKHVGLEFVTMKLGPKPQLWLALLCKIFMLVFFGLFTFEAWLMVVNDGCWQISPAMQIPLYIPYSVLFLGGLLTLAEIGFEMLKDLRSLRPIPVSNSN